jgi:serralysin
VHAIDRGGASLQAVANGFIGSPEFLTRYGASTTNTEFVTLLYNNVLNRDPDTGGLQNWLDALARARRARRW